MKNLVLIGILLISFLKIYAQDQIVLNVNANYMAYSKFNDRLYVTVSSTDMNYGNQLIVINPHTGVIESSLFVGSEPGEIAISPNNEYIYVILKGSPKIIRVNSETFSIDKHILINRPGSTDIYYAKHMAIVTGSPKDIVVSRSEGSYVQDVFLIKDGVLQPDSIGYFPAYKISVLLMGSVTDMVFGYNDESTGYDFSTIKITPTGLQYLTSYSNVVSGFAMPILVNDLVYTNYGDVVDPYFNPPMQIANCVLLEGASSVTVNTVTNEIIYGRMDFWQNNLLHLERFSNTMFNLKGRNDIEIVDLPPSSYSTGMYCLNATLNTGLAFLTGNYDNVGSIVILTDSTGYTATEKSIDKNEISIYPNPAENYLTIDGNIDFAEVYNTNGQFMIRLNTKGKIDVSDFPAGLYYTRVFADNWTKTYKFLKK